MRITNSTNTIERGDVGEERAFSIEWNDKMARILSKGIYKNVIRAPIRELACNALDSHRAAGKLDVPFLVHLPNTLEPYFEVQDFGLGLSDEQVHSLYTRYGASNKSHSNEDIGGFGLGSKSPFAYTSNFTVASVHLNVRRTYVLYVNDKGRPSVSLMGEEQTTDCNGVSVRIPVKPTDFEAFRENAEETFRWFDHRPTVVGNSRYSVRTHTVVDGMQGRKWMLLSQDSRSSYYRYNTQATAVMANVAYPIRAENLHSRFNRLVGYPLVVQFENGELEPAVSREDLNYDDATVQVLEARLDAVMQDLQTKMEAMISTASSLWQARVAMRAIVQAYSTGDIMRTLIHSGYTPKWKDQPLGEYNHYGWRTTKENPGPTVSLVSETYRARFVTEIAVDENVVFVLKDCADATARCRKAFYENKTNRRRVYLVQGNSVNEERSIWNATKCPLVAAWMADVGNPPTILASSLPRVEKKTMTFKGRAWTGRGSTAYYNASKSRNWDDEKQLTSDQGGFYVTVEGLTPTLKDVGEIDLEGILRAAVEAGVVLKGTTVWGINKTNSRLIADNPKWQEFYSTMRQKVMLMVEQNNLGLLINYRAELNGANNRLSGTAKEWHTRVGQLGNLLGKYAREWQRVSQIMDQHPKVDSLRVLCRLLSVSVKEPSSQAVNLENLWSEVVSAYPLLRYATRTYPNSREFDDFVTYVNQVDAASA